MTVAVDWWVLCERVIEDLATRNLTLVGTLNDVFAPAFPAQHPWFACAARLRRSPGAAAIGDAWTFRVCRGDVGRAPQVVAEFAGQWPAEHVTTHVYANFPGLRLMEPGEIAFWLEWRAGEGAWTAGPRTVVRALPWPVEAAVQG